MTQQETSNQRTVLELIESYRQGFLQLDPGRLASIWDREHIPLVYFAMERPEPIQGWSAIENYFKALPQHLEQVIEKKIGPIKVDAFGDAAVAFFESHSIVKLKGGEGLYRPSARATMCFHRALGGWRAIHYHESALAAQAADQFNRMKASVKSGHGP
jgi:ketosteroid isomerase-like protein